MKQTAVDWLYNNLKSHFEHDGDLLEAVQFSFNQAKEIEKGQIVKANRDGVDMVADKKNFLTGEQYYNETFGKSNLK